MDQSIRLAAALDRVVHPGATQGRRRHRRARRLIRVVLERVDPPLVVRAKQAGIERRRRG
jgi:hypothetical protein